MKDWDGRGQGRAASNVRRRPTRDDNWPFGVVKMASEQQTIHTENTQVILNRVRYSVGHRRDILETIVPLVATFIRRQRGGFFDWNFVELVSSLACKTELVDTTAKADSAETSGLLA